MEVMEDGNLMDKVHILIQRDMEYYKVRETSFIFDRQLRCTLFTKTFESISFIQNPRM